MNENQQHSSSNSSYTRKGKKNCKNIDYQKNDHYIRDAEQRGQCILLSVVFTLFTAVFGSYLSAFNSFITKYCGCGLAYPYDWRGFVEPNRRRAWTSQYIILLLCSGHAKEADEGRRALLLIMIISRNNILAFVLLLSQSSFLSLLQAEVFRARNKKAFRARCLPSPLSPLHQKPLRQVHCKKGKPFSRPQPGCHKPNSPRTGIIKLFPPRDSLVGEIPAGDGENGNLFFTVQ